MAIEFYIGAEGSGKTYQVVTVTVREALKQGRRVFTNIPAINAEVIIQHIKENDFPSDYDFTDYKFGTVEYFRSHEIHDNPKFYPDLSDRNFVSMSDLGDLSQYRVQGGDLFIIDECFEVYHRERKLPLHDETFFRKHRKYISLDTKLTTEIIIMTQDKKACNKYLLGTVTFTYEATKKEEIGQPNRYNIDIYKGIPLYREKPYKQLTLQSYDKDKFTWYKSHAEEGAKQQTLDTRKDAISKRKIILMLAFPVLFIAVIVYALKTLSEPDEEHLNDNSSTQSAGTQQTSTNNNKPEDTTTNDAISQVFYITGIVERGSQRIFYLSDGTITKTVINPQKIERFGRTYNLYWNEQWYTNYSYTQHLQSSSKQPMQTK